MSFYTNSPILCMELDCIGYIQMCQLCSRYIQIALLWQLIAIQWVEFFQYHAQRYAWQHKYKLHASFHFPGLCTVVESNTITTSSLIRKIISLSLKAGMAKITCILFILGVIYVFQTLYHMQLLCISVTMVSLKRGQNRLLLHSALVIAVSINLIVQAQSCVARSLSFLFAYGCGINFTHTHKKKNLSAW